MIQTLYAYCNSSLLQHSINVAEKLKVFIERGDTIVLCNKITNTLKAKHKSIDEKLVRNQCLELARLAAFLHDIGKGLEIYQDPSHYKVIEGECKASYVFHEVFSAVIMRRLMENVLTKYIKLEELRLIPVIVALYHHYTMERLDFEKIRDYLDKLKGKALLHKEATNIIVEASRRTLRNVDVEDKVIEKRVVSKPVKIIDIEDLFLDIDQFYRSNKRLLLLYFGIVSQIAVADYIVASIERRGVGSKYYRDICREAPWLCSPLDKK